VAMATLLKFFIVLLILTYTVKFHDDLTLDIQVQY